MKGIEISKEYYKQFGEPMLKKDFPELLSKISVGLCGSGSECYGFDDDISRDHDFSAGFCIFIPDEDLLDRRSAFLLERAYYKLPKEFMGLKRSAVNPAGGNRVGVIKISDFFINKVGSPDGQLSTNSWLTIPESFLAEATNGEIFYDGAGIITDIRRRLKNMPEDIRLKRLAGNLVMMEQSGLYNYNRCISHGETAAAQLALTEFCKTTLAVAFLLNKTYMPYYKWAFKALRRLQKLGTIYDGLEFLISSDNSQDNIKLKNEIINDISAMVLNCTKELSNNGSNELSVQASALNEQIKDSEIRNLNILYCV